MTRAYGQRPRRIVHGTFVAYTDRGCRCAVCVDAHNERVRASRAERLASGRLNHGTRSAYDAGCRCDPCRAARHEAYLRLEKVGIE